MKDIKKNWDLVIIGGGITGAGIFRETVRMDLNVLLVEQQDFAAVLQSWFTVACATSKKAKFS